MGLEQKPSSKSNYTSRQYSTTAKIQTGTFRKSKKIDNPT
jgi:hypothetical protein